MSLHRIHLPPSRAGCESPWTLLLNVISELGLRLPCRALLDLYKTCAGIMQMGEMLLYHHFLCHRQCTRKKIKLTDLYLKRDKCPQRILVHSTKHFKKERDIRHCNFKQKKQPQHHHQNKQESTTTPSSKQIKTNLKKNWHKAELIQPLVLLKTQALFPPPQHLSFNSM